MMQQEMTLTILDILGRHNPREYILNDSSVFSDEEEALLEDSDFLFLTKEHPENMCGRLRATPQKMASLWRRAGDFRRATIFTTLTKEI